MAVLDRIKNAWNAFRVKENLTNEWDYSVTPSYGTRRPDKPRLFRYTETSLVSAIYTRISIDVAAAEIRHTKIDEQGRYLEDMRSSLNTVLMLEPNIDQAPRSFRQDIAMTLFDKGVAAIVPVDTSDDPGPNDRYDIYTLRVGEIVSWMPKHVRVNLYNEKKGAREEIVLEKKYIAIVENPLYGVMNEPNGTLQRLIRKLSLLDTVDEATGSGKLDLIIQLPYVIKSEARRQQAMQRKEDIEFQLKSSQYGIAYTDGTEKITQLNRPAESNLLNQVKYLTDMLYGQLGITEGVMNGTADEKTMINYYERTVKPVLDAITESMQKAFLGYLGTMGREKISYFKDPFRLVPVGEIAEIADKFTRNEILTSNEIRGFLGIEPATDPKADMLMNSNMPQPNPAMVEAAMAQEDPLAIGEEVTRQMFQSSLKEFNELGLRKGVQNGSRF